MEATLMITSLTLGGFFLFPQIVDFLKENATVLVGSVVLLTFLYVIAPYSPELTTGFSAVFEGVPELFADAGLEFENQVTEVSSAYYNAFGNS